MSFFKAYDMRGTFGADFDLDLVRRVGAALPQVVAGGRWLVGRDCRTTSDAVRDALVGGLAAAGAEVADLGLATTPMVYFFTAEDGYDGSVMVTASHNPPSDNGLKVSRGGALPVGYADGLDKVERLVGESTAPVVAGRASQVADALPRYVRWQREAAASAPYSSLRYAVDCSNGMASLLAGELFPGAEIINGTIDGTFPAHSPNPLKAEARAQIAAVVRERGLDCGVIFDGDADRAMFVDERGEFVQPDYLIPVVARATTEPVLTHGLAQTYGLRDSENVSGVSREQIRVLTVQPIKIIHDVRTSRGATETLREDGFEPVMVPVGHAFAKPALRRTGALCGGELAGHYYFREFHCCDSGVLAATRVLGEIARAKAAGRSFSEMMRPIVSRYANSGEMNFEVADKDAAIARVVAAAESLAAVESESRIDGVRLDFADGWVSVRKSNTEPYLRLIVECRTPEMLDEWKGRLIAAVKW